MAFQENIRTIKNWFISYLNNLEFIENQLIARIKEFSDRANNHEISLNEAMLESAHCETIMLTLYLSLIEALSRFRFPKSNPQKRFVEFVTAYSGYEQIYSLISIPLLIKEIKELENKRIIQQTIDDIKKKCPQMTLEWGNKNYPDSKFCFENLRNQYHLPDKILIKCRYANILYTNYRCNIIHEGKVPREHSNIFGEGMLYPYYYSFSPDTEDLEKTEFCLDFPMIFIKQTAKNCLDNLCCWFEKNNVNPFDLISKKE